MTDVTFNEIGLVALLAAAAVFFFVYGFLTPWTAQKAPDGTETGGTVDGDTDALFDRVFRPMLRNFIPQTPLAAQLTGDRRDKITALLISSGNPWRLTPEEYVGSMWLGGIIGSIAGLFMGVFIGFSPVYFAAGGALVGAYLPRYWYRRNRSLRIDEANRTLPEGIDLLRIVMVSGQKFESAISEVSRRLPEGLIKVEFGRVSADLRAGRGLDATLQDFARRIPAEAVESFARAIIQGERLGAPVAETLESQSDSIRRAHEARIDKAVAALETTIFLPILIGLVPAIFVIIAAPAVTSILNYL
jgi:tight adherence protein C